MRLQSNSCTLASLSRAHAAPMKQYLLRQSQDTRDPLQTQLKDDTSPYSSTPSSWRPQTGVLSAHLGNPEKSEKCPGPPSSMPKPQSAWPPPLKADSGVPEGHLRSPFPSWLSSCTPPYLPWPPTPHPNSLNKHYCVRCCKRS